MATKTSGTRTSSGHAGHKAPATSRKALRKTTAAYARKVDDDSDEDKNPGAKAEAGKAAEAAKADAKDTAPAKEAAPARVEAKEAAPARAEAKEAAPARPAAKAEAAPAPEPPAAPPPAAPRAPLVEALPAGPYEVNQGEYAVLLPPGAIGKWDPDSPAEAPGKAPPGDSRSFRRVVDGVAEFTLIYRYDSFLITRSGKVGVQGNWKVVEYPYIGSAAHAYAQECSVLTAAGYRDLR